MTEKRKTLEQLLGSRFFSESETKVKPTQAELMSLFAEISSYFFKLYGDKWLNTLDDTVESFWRLHLVGLTIDDVVLGIEHMQKKGKTQFPPNALEFRGYCLGYGVTAEPPVPTVNKLKLIT